MRPSACSQFRTKPLMLILCRDVQRSRLLCKMYLSTPQYLNFFSIIKPGFHIFVSVVSVMSVVRKKFIGQKQLYGNLLYKCSIQQKREIQLVVRDRMNSICPMNFFRRTDTTDTTDTMSIWKPGLIFKIMSVIWLRTPGRYILCAFDSL